MIFFRILSNQHDAKGTIAELFLICGRMLETTKQGVIQCSTCEFSVHILHQTCIFVLYSLSWMKNLCSSTITDCFSSKLQRCLSVMLSWHDLRKRSCFRIQWKFSWAKRWGYKFNRDWQLNDQKWCYFSESTIDKVVVTS